MEHTVTNHNRKKLRQPKAGSSAILPSLKGASVPSANPGLLKMPKSLKPKPPKSLSLKTEDCKETYLDILHGVLAVGWLRSRLFFVTVPTSLGLDRQDFGFGL